LGEPGHVFIIPQEMQAETSGAVYDDTKAIHTV
jgi:hypothetical protein